jgi:hypothetical protein
MKNQVGNFSDSRLGFGSSEGARVDIIDFGRSNEPSEPTALPEEIPAETGVHIEGLGLSVFLVGVAVVLAGLSGWSGEDVLAVIVEVHLFFFPYYF